MSEAELDYVHMHSAPDSVRHIFRNHPENSSTEIEEFRLALGYERFLPHMKIEEDLVEFLELAKNDYNLAISTNRGNTMAPLLKMFDLENYFEKVVTSETATRPKPAPDGLLEIMEYFNCSAQETIFIGDSVIDQEHASACNVSFIAFKNAKLVADYHVTSFMELCALPPFQK